MAGTNRDNFLESTKRILAFRSNHRCSFTGCQQITCGPSMESADELVTIGVASHIHAAAPGGPRYLASMSPEERSSSSNGIWLCPTHSVLIDRDEATYTAGVLRQMKREHETVVASQLNGRASATESDFIALGPDILFAGELTGVDQTGWRLRVDQFLIGDLARLVDYGERFDDVSPHDQYVLVNALGDGRQLSSRPTFLKTATGFEITCDVCSSAQRTPAANLGLDLAINDANDLFLDDAGNLATVSGLQALPQKIKLCLSTPRGAMPFHPEFGSRLVEYFSEFKGSPWLDRLIHLDVIRMACIPYLDPHLGDKHTQLQSVRRVLRVEQTASASSKSLIEFRMRLEVEGVGEWVTSAQVSVAEPERY